MKLMSFKSRTALWPYTAKGYEQNGLINQLDGIENAGYGIHDSTSYVDLITGASFQSVGTTTVNADSYVFAGSNYIYGDGAGILAAITAQSATIELCLTPTGIRNNGGVFALSENATNRNFWMWSHNTTPAYAFFSGARYGGSGYVGPVMGGLPTSGVLTVTFVDTSAVFYWNGQLVFTTNRNGTMNANYKRLSIGFITTGSYGLFSLHSMRLYNRILSTPEIAANYAVDKARFKIGGAE